MKQLILSMALLISATGMLFAQNDDDATPVVNRMRMNKADQTFKANANLLNLKAFVVLKEGRMILELAAPDDFESFSNIDSLLSVFMKDIAFYKDSLDAYPTSGFRIDYVLNPDYDFKKIRFIRHPQQGSTFLNKSGTMSRLKFDQDTIHILINKSRPGIGRKKDVPCQIPYTIEATFIVGNYYDIDNIIKDSILHPIIDTLAKISRDQRPRHDKHPWFMNRHPLSLVYNPYYTGAFGKKIVSHYSYLLQDEYSIFDKKYHPTHWKAIKGDVGVGVIRNTLTPMCELGYQFNRQIWPEDFITHDALRISASPYCFFANNTDGSYTVNDNWFLNVSWGTLYGKPQHGWPGLENSLGFGYLVSQKGNYFKNGTFKLYTNLRYDRNGITIVPEIIFSDRCRQVYPGVTVKFF